ncbi:MAG: hypothetical protein J0G30_08715 [Actinomycetales bacterium]|nr:hypothetical protein [Actinomycetales bacterium]
MPASRPARPADEAPAAATLSKKEQRRLSKHENDEISREMAIVRQREKRRRRIMNRVFLVTGIVAGVAIVAAAVGYGVWRHGQDELAGPANMLSDGLVLTGDGSTITAWTTPALQAGEEPVATPANATSGVPAVLAYLDFGDPTSATFWNTNLDNLTNWGTAGYLSLEIHPVALSDDQGYSALAARAFACTADLAPDSAMAVTGALFAAAPAAGVAPPSSGELADDVLQAVGTPVDGLHDCITSGRFEPWVEAATARATAGPLPSDKVDALTTTPLVLADGAEFTGDPSVAEDFAEFLAATYAAEAVQNGGSDGSADGNSAQ